MGYRRILITLDGSRLAEQSLKQVLMITEPGAQIHLLSIMAPVHTDEVATIVNGVGQSSSLEKKQGLPLNEPKQPHEEKVLYRYLEEVTDWLERAGYAVSVEVRTSDSTIDAILEVARANFEVIIMSTHRRKGIGLAVLGSVTQGVLAKAPCPVLVISPSRAEGQP